MILCGDGIVRKRVSVAFRSAWLGKTTGLVQQGDA
jgi:hypothetical protein